MSLCIYIDLTEYFINTGYLYICLHYKYQIIIDGNLL